MGKVFDDYGEYYDLLYSEKNYESEARYVLELVRLYGKGGTTLLELGCGTGNHAKCFAEAGYGVTGIDQSGRMVEEARRKYAGYQINFYEGDARTYRDGRNYDVVVSLFHVASYQTTNEDVRRFFNTASTHLRPGGVFIFDFWYGPAVLTSRPEVRVKRVENDRIRVVRIAEPEMDVRRSVVVVNYELLIQEKHTEKLRIVRERHEMRYFAELELQQWLESCGLHSLHSEEWRSKKALSESSWNGLWVAAKSQ